jgi:hypothetical protein
MFAVCTTLICEQKTGGICPVLLTGVAHLAVPYGGRQDARLEPKYKQH